MSQYVDHLQVVQKRFDEALEANGFDSVLIYAGHPRYAFLDDNPYSYRVNPMFKYWIPVTESPKSFIFYRRGETPRVFLYQARDFWHAQPQLPPGEWQEKCDVTLIDNIDQVRAALTDELPHAALISEPLEPLDRWNVKALNPQGLIDHLHYQRANKTAWEMANMRKANLLAARGHEAAKAAFFAGKSELEISHAYYGAMKFRESQAPYNSIIGLNEHAAVLHYDVYETEAPAEHRSFLIDAGAYYNGYCADITRTYAAKPGFFAELVEAVDRAEQEIIALIKPGVQYYDLHVETHRKIAAILHEFGFFKVDANTIYERGYTSAFFPHGLGHYIGLQVHDVGGYLKNPKGESFERDARHPFLRLRREVEEGNVFTIEPGLYVVDQLLEAFDGNEDFNWQRVAELRPFGGVRIEDSVIVTKDGSENITRDAFAALN
ncbi:Xaa-Pro dipeptidase [Aliidiomarina sanyensis]|uniref:Xaa-Pro dipeptidase n=1 Tax=Aliidiomarina sanyensis TaxID=1249555 RepID=A0A432WCJ7_9GAMM|nr:Xaa-Pro dipeptidase [Aliidiomarina sanyensis]RUO30159.1 Xaa-Pro dipeptidase [Aliidiomarina sanyensis]